MGKGVIARYEQFLLFPQCFQILVSQGHQKVSLCGNGLHRFSIGQNPVTWRKPLLVIFQWMQWDYFGFSYVSIFRFHLSCFCPILTLRCWISPMPINSFFGLKRIWDKPLTLTKMFIIFIFTQNIKIIRNISTRMTMSSTKAHSRNEGGVKSRQF